MSKLMEKMQTTIECVDCFKIVCKQCGWEATDMDVIKIQKGEMTACPVCGWKPN
jgi:DNA-directed RNA polymerase subunit RPC12/RpoP